MYSPVNFRCSKGTRPFEIAREKIKKYISDNKLQPIQYGELDLKLYPYYYDGTEYYRNDKNQIVRTTLSQVYIDNVLVIQY